MATSTSNATGPGGLHGQASSLQNTDALRLARHRAVERLPFATPRSLKDSQLRWNTLIRITILLCIGVSLRAQALLVGAPVAVNAFVGMDNLSVAAGFTLSGSTYVATITAMVVEGRYGFSLQNSLTAPITTLAYSIVTLPLSPSIGNATITVDQTLPAGTYYLVATGSSPAGVAGWFESDGRTFVTNAGSVQNGIWASSTLANHVPPAGQWEFTPNVVVNGIPQSPAPVLLVSGSTAGSAAWPAVGAGGVVPVDSPANTIQPGEWASIYGTNLASSTLAWDGSFPTSLGGTSVTINGKAAYLSYVSPTQINLQAPDDTTTGPVTVVVTSAGVSAISTVTLAQSAPSFLLLDSQHVAGIISRVNGSGAYGGGTYDIIGPTGSSLGYATVAAKAGDTVELFAVGFGPTNPVELAGQSFSGAARTTSPVSLFINHVNVEPAFVGLSGAGLYQINLVVPNGLGTGDVSLAATVGEAQTPSGVVISLQ